jgi:cytochrome c
MNSASFFVHAVMFGVGLLALPTAYGQQPRALLQQYKCDTCHSERETKTGPAYADLSARYRGDSSAFASLVVFIKQGRRDAGPWHMPPHPEISDAEARAIARYILSVRE